MLNIANIVNMLNITNISRSPSTGIYPAARPVAAPQQEYTPPPDQWQPLNRNIPRRQTSGSPSTGIFPAARPVAAPQQEYTSSQVPDNWEEHQNDEQNIYYFNSLTGVSTWTHPLEDQVRGWDVTVM
eukprot:3269183-Pyramimonas_sp.AAC.1